MKFAAFTQDNWNSSNLEMQKLLQLETLKKGSLGGAGLQRKSSKENSSAKSGPSGTGGHGGMINNLVFTNNSLAMDSDDSLIMMSHK